MNYVVLTFRIGNNQLESRHTADRIASLILNKGEKWSRNSFEMTVTLANTRVAEFATDMMRAGFWED